MRGIPFFAVLVVTLLSSCARNEGPDAQNATPETPGNVAEAPQTTEAAGGPHALVHLKSGGRIPGTIVASSQTDMVVAGDDGIEHRVPLSQVKSVEYGDATEPKAAPTRSVESRAPNASRNAQPPSQPQPSRESAQQPSLTPSPATTPPPVAVTTKTYQLPVGSEISVRTDETIDSETAAEGQTFAAQVTRDATDAHGDVVIPRRSKAWVVIRSASQGGRIRGASDLVLDLQSVEINGKRYTIETADVTKKGREGVGANRRTAEYTGGGAALGAIIGAIAGGGKGAAIGAGAGAGAGALTQILTKGKAIKVPAESVLTFKLDKPLEVSAVN